GFVFYDEAERPVAFVEVCFSCGEVALQPGTGDVYTTLTKNSIGLRELCHELGFPDCQWTPPFDENRKALINRAIDEEYEHFLADLRTTALERAGSPILRDRVTLGDYVVSSYSNSVRWKYGRAFKCKDDTTIFSTSPLRCAEWVREHRV